MGPYRTGRPLNPALDFEDDGASFRVRQERRHRRGRLSRWFRETPLPRLFFWICLAAPLAFAGIVIGAALVTVLVG
jgi:hypothetical protein